MSVATGLTLGLAVAMLALFLITGHIPSGYGSLFTSRKAAPVPYWLGIGFYVFALLVALLIVGLRAARGLSA